MREKIIRLSLWFLLIVLVSACSSSTFTKEEEKKYMENYYELASKPSEPSLLIEELDKNIARLSSEESSNAVDALLYSMYQKQKELNDKISGLQDVMSSYQDDGINFNVSQSYSRIKDSTLKAFLGEIQKEKFLVINDNGGFTVVPNMGEILQKYEMYMTDALKDMILFSKSEYDKPFFDFEKEKFDLDVVVERILMMEEGLKKHFDSSYVNAFKESKAYYYQIYFGVNNGYMIDSQKNLLEEVLEHYQKTLKDHPNTQLANDLNAYLEKLKQSKNKMTDDVIVFLTDLTTAEVIEVNSENDENISSNSDEAKRNAIQEAIQENKK
ncbi:hypothetical protein NDS46_30555 (plasmid) [Paenibacillus thiaminolyticus]|uniref:hypothetical protein n=1 Tax=Paenibacillus thiaminolyticus TaxID=49283 RepID=UPI00232B79F2|nr:hypothetical protein [Paenibacillus thiaminolyticus]WCF11691.1 hypothetical protein NDS46_30555 [Paenibacillus thiaminolyticus]